MPFRRTARNIQPGVADDASDVPVLLEPLAGESLDAVEARAKALGASRVVRVGSMLSTTMSAPSLRLIAQFAHVHQKRVKHPRR
jgi:hypothetical protein